MKPHQERVVLEKQDLDEKLARLEAFLDKPMPPGMDDAEWTRLILQSKIMGLYSAILGDRIRAFGPMDCPHAAPFRYCQKCVATPCPIGLDK